MTTVEPDAGGVPEIGARSRVAAVTVLQDRAQVTRTAEADLPAGSARLRLDDVAPVLVDGTLTAVADGATVHDARVVRRRIAVDADQPADVAVLDDRIAVLTEQHRTLAARVEIDGEAVAAAAEAARLTMADLAEDSIWGRLDSDTWRAARERVDAAEAARRHASADTHDALARASEELEDLRARRAALDHPATGIVASVLLDVTGDGGPVAVTLTYVVPSALWRPAHRAHLGGGTVTVHTDAVVWQRTGEAWRDVEVACSTAQPSLGASPPPLVTDRVVARRSSGIAVEAREEDVQTTGLGGAATLDEVPAVDDGGEVRVLRPAARVTVASDGLPHRLPVATATAAATASLVAVPELAEAVVLRTEQVHPGPGPLLAGPVELVRDHGAAGRTSTRFIAPGERWALAWGPEPDLRVTREAHEVAEAPSGLTGRQTTRRTVTVRLSNLGPAERLVEVTERVPVSEVDEVVVEVDRRATAPAAQADADGFVRWLVRLAGHGHAELRLAYTVTRTRSVTGL